MDSHKLQLMIDWVNTLPMDSCLLVSSLEDLVSGEALCDIFNHVYNAGEEGQFHLIIDRSKKRGAGLRNIKLLLTSLPHSQSLKYMLAQQPLELLAAVSPSK